MPIYEYRCAKCGAEFDQLILPHEPAQGAACPGCGSHDTEKLISAANFELRGTGWYKTDYAPAPKPDAEAGSTG